MKKLFVCVLSLVLALSVAACGGKNTETSAPTTREGDTSYDANGTAIIGSDPKTWGPAEEGENVQIPGKVFWQVGGVKLP